MSSFTDHTAISPSASKWWMRENDASYSYWTDLFWQRITITVPKWYKFDAASVPKIFWILIQKTEPDTICSAWIHDFIYTDMRWIWRIKADLIFLESLIVYNVPKLFDEKRYWFAFLKILQYIAMTVVLLLFSWIVRYDVRWKMKKIFKFFLSC